MLLRASHLYRNLFRSSEVLERPWLMVGVQVITSDTDAAARRLFTTSQQRFLRLIRNQPVGLLPPVDSLDAIDHPWNALEKAAVENRLSAAIVGSENTVKAGLEKLVAETGADEIIAVTDTWDHEARLDSYRRLARIAAAIDSKILAATNSDPR